MAKVNSTTPSISHQISQVGFDKLQTQLQELLEKRPQVVIRLDNARRMGDLSENSEYTSAREQLSFLDGRILELRELIKTAKIINTSSIGSSGVANLGSTLRVITADGREAQYTLVGEFEADLASGKISITSPLGSALLGKKLGETAKYLTPSGEKMLHIKNVS